MPSRRPKALRSANNLRGAVLCRRTSHLHFAEPWMCHETLMPSLMPPSRELLDMFEINDENPWKENIALLAVSSEHLKDGTVCSCVCVCERQISLRNVSFSRKTYLPVIFLWNEEEIHESSCICNCAQFWNGMMVEGFKLGISAWFRTGFRHCFDGGFTFPLFRHIGRDFTSRLFNVVTKYLNQWLLLHSWNWDRWDHVSWLN